MGYTYRNIDSTYTTTQVATLTNTYGGAAHNLSYTYDANGNILSVSDGSKTTSYVYDTLGQLTRENNQAAGKTWTWTYDTGGNILSRSEYAYTTGTLGTATDTVTYTYGDASWGDLLTAYDGSAIAYDGGGNMTAFDGWTYTWQGGRQLAGMSNGTTSLSFEYNESGLRTKKSDGTTTHKYIYRGEQLIADVTGSDALYFRYDQNGDLLGFRYNNAEYTYVKNLQGDILAILDSTGAEVASYTYDAWGNILSSSGSLADRNPLRYRGYVYDTETGLYYLHSRYYNPEIGRFMNADAYAQTYNSAIGANMFAYCLNNPVNISDSEGCRPKWVDKLEENLTTAKEKLANAYKKTTEVVKSILENLEFSAGVGQGIYVETTVLDVVGVSAGAYGNYVAVNYKDGELSFSQETNVGASIEFLWLEFGAAENRVLTGNQIETTRWIGFNDTKESLTIFSASAYLLYLGGTIEIGFDTIQFSEDITQIFKE